MAPLDAAEAPLANWTTLCRAARCYRSLATPRHRLEVRLTLKYFTDGVSVTSSCYPAVNGSLLHWVLPPVLSGLSSMMAPRSATRD